MPTITGYRFKLRRGTAANWTYNNPVLLRGEPGIEIDTQKWKVGDGALAWVDLPYMSGGAPGGGSINWMGAWSGATAYVEGDAVSLNGSSYICILAHTNHTPP